MVRLSGAHRQALRCVLHLPVTLTLLGNIVQPFQSTADAASSLIPKKSLGHIRVLDLTRVLAGPWCTQNLADLGADVIKIERPGVGDDTRSWGPPYLKDAQGRDSSEAAYYVAANRGKRSVTLDIASVEGQAIVRELALQSDVVLENYKVGQLKKYGLDYESLKQIKPDLVYCSITGFGQDGPYAERPGYDFIVQGIGGFMSITGERDDLPGGGPQKAGVAICDLMTGMYASIAVLAALTHRDRTGEGQYIDMAVVDDPQAKARGICVDLPHPATGHVKLTASPMKLAVTPPQYETAPPLLGQHTDEVLGKLLGYRPDQIASLRDKGIV